MFEPENRNKFLVGCRFREPPETLILVVTAVVFRSIILMAGVASATYAYILYESAQLELPLGLFKPLAHDVHVVPVPPRLYLPVGHKVQTPPLAYEPAVQVCAQLGAIHQEMNIMLILWILAIIWF